MSKMSPLDSSGLWLTTVQNLLNPFMPRSDLWRISVLMERCHGSLIQKVQSVLSVKKMLRMSIIFCLIDPNSKLTLNLSGKS